MLDPPRVRKLTPSQDFFFPILLPRPAQNPGKVRFLTHAHTRTHTQVPSSKKKCAQEGACRTSSKEVASKRPSLSKKVLVPELGTPSLGVGLGANMIKIDISSLLAHRQQKRGCVYNIVIAQIRAPYTIAFLCRACLCRFR